MWLAEKLPTAKLTYGYHRYEIMGAILSVILIWAITGVLIFEAIERFINPPESVDGRHSRSGTYAVVMFACVTSMV